MGVLENPLGMWKSDILENQRTVMYMFFDKELPYSLKNGFGTASLDCNLKILRSFGTQKNSMVEMGGIGHRFSPVGEPVDPASLTFVHCGIRFLRNS